MNISRLKKVFAGISVAAITLTQVGTVLAAYRDVPAGVWYENAVDAFLDAGYLDAGQTNFRGGDPANRAEFVKLVVELNGGILSTPPAVPSFDDVAPGAWYYGYMEEAGKEGWVRGDGNCYGGHPCYARAGANINRAEAAALIVRAFGLEATDAAAQFVDNPSGQWYTDVIQTAADHCVLQGDDATSRVRPGDNMNRAEMVVMLRRVDQGLQYGVDCGGDDMGAELDGIRSVMTTSATTIEVEFNTMLNRSAAEDAGNYTVAGLSVSDAVMVDDSTVELTFASPMQAREDYTVTVNDMESADGDMFSDSMAFVGYSPVVQGDGILEVTKSSSNPMGDTVPKGAVGVVLVSADFTASCDDSVTIENLTVLHEGFGDETEIGGVYAAIDGARVTRKRTIDSEDQTAELRFSTPLVIDACQSVTVDIVADFSSTATVSSEHNLTVELPSDIDSNAKEVSGNFPLRGNTFRIAAVTSGAITVEYRTVSPDEVEVGDKQVVVGKFELSTDSVEDQTFYSMTFEQNGSSSDADFVNISVRRSDGTVLTNVAQQTVGDFVTLVFDPPFTILEGDKITLEVVADVVGGAGDSIVFHFEESSDIFAVGSLYGYGVNGQLYGSQITLPAETTTLPDTVTIDAGQFTIEVDGPSEQTYTSDDDDAVLANIRMTTGGEDIDIKDLFILVQATTSTGAGLPMHGSSTTTTDDVFQVLEDVELRNTVTGRTVSAVRLTTQGTATAGDFFTSTTETWQIYRFDDFVVRGRENWEFRVDFIGNSSGHPLNGDKFRVHICGEPTHILSGGSLTANTTGCSFGGLITAVTTYQMDVEGISTGDNVGDVRPRGNISGNFHRIASPTLDIAVKTTGTSETAVENAKNITLLRYEARASEAEDLLITKAVFDSRSGSLLNGQNYTLWVDTDGDGAVDTILEDGVAAQGSPATISFADWVGGGYVVPAEETVLFEVHSDISASLVNNDLRVKFATGSSVTFLEAEEVDDGSSLSGLKVNGTCSSTCDINLTTADTKLWSLVSQGNLFVTKDTTPTRSRQLLGGTLSEPVLRLNFRAQNENVDVTDIQISSSGSNASSVDRLELYKSGEATPFANATIGGCGSDDVLTTNPGTSWSVISTFCANMESSQLVVPDGSDLDVLVRARMKADTAGGTSGQRIEFWITPQAVSNNSVGSGAVRARGAESSNDLIANTDANATGDGEVFIGRDAPTATNAVVRGDKNDSVLAKFTSIVNANPDPNGSNVPTGVRPFGQFKFTAASHSNSLNGLNDAVLSGVTFNVNATNVLMDSTKFKFYNKANSSVKGQCQAFKASNQALIVLNASGSMLVRCLGLSGSGVDVSLASGEQITFVLEGEITNSQVSSSATSTLQAALQDFTTLTNTSFALTSGSSHIDWRDTDTASTSFKWIEYDETVVNSTSYQS